MKCAGQMEEWRPVVGWEGLYEVSDLGRVRSVARIVTRRGGRPYRVRECIRKASVDARSGYAELPLCRDGEGKTHRVHVLVLEAFAGPRPDGNYGRHLNGNPSDNRLENLAWGTPTQNNYDAVAHGTHWAAAKTHCKHGHELTPGNTYVRPEGGRACRACGTERAKRRWSSKSPEERAAIADVRRDRRAARRAAR